jgi:hypothetical protein
MISPDVITFPSVIMGECSIMGANIRTSKQMR